MINKKIIKMSIIVTILILLISVSGCSRVEKITQLSQLEDKTFAVPEGTIADQLVLTKFPNAKFQYYDTVLDSCLAVKSGKADAAAYDEPILRNIAAKNKGLRILPDLITIDDYGFAVQINNIELKNDIDEIITELENNGKYDEMLKHWLPKEGIPAPMPDIELTGSKGVLRFGTAAITEPFSFIDSNQKIVGFDIELAMYVAQKLDMQIEVINMDFGEMIPALIADKLDIIGACITISDERAKDVLFSKPYYTGGIAALVSEK
ncbi:MAG: transporter substrate-binding domain-containing protein [Actinobacteria bacterium]|nr:transporter substrate-binding domain-containing protein [Actinomycetota bacterium]